MPSTHSKVAQNDMVECEKEEASEDIKGRYYSKLNDSYIKEDTDFKNHSESPVRPTVTQQESGGSGSRYPQVQVN